MLNPNPSRRFRLWPLALVVALGCSNSGPEEPAPQDPGSVRLVPVSGVVTLNGKPLAHAVVTFLPKTYGAANGETDQNGKYSLKYAMRDGVPPGDYKVAISYLLSTKGDPQGLGPRSALVLPPGMNSAKEQLPPEYSDLGRTTLKRTVGNDGGTFDFDLPASIQPPEKAGENAPKKEAETVPVKKD